MLLGTCCRPLPQPCRPTSNQQRITTIHIIHQAKPSPSRPAEPSQQERIPGRLGRAEPKGTTPSPAGSISSRPGLRQRSGAESSRRWQCRDEPSRVKLFRCGRVRCGLSGIVVGDVMCSANSGCLEQKSQEVDIRS